MFEEGSGGCDVQGMLPEGPDHDVSAVVAVPKGCGCPLAVAGQAEEQEGLSGEPGGSGDSGVGRFSLRVLGGVLDGPVVQVLAGEVADAPPSFQGFIDVCGVLADGLKRGGEEAAQALLAAGCAVRGEGGAASAVNGQVGDQDAEPADGGFAELGDALDQLRVLGSGDAHGVALVGGAAAA